MRLAGIGPKTALLSARGAADVSPAVFIYFLISRCPWKRSSQDPAYAKEGSPVQIGTRIVGLISIVLALVLPGMAMADYVTVRSIMPPDS